VINGNALIEEKLGEVKRRQIPSNGGAKRQRRRDSGSSREKKAWEGL